MFLVAMQMNVCDIQSRQVDKFYQHPAGQIQLMSSKTDRSDTRSHGPRVGYQPAELHRLRATLGGVQLSASNSQTGFVGDSLSFLVGSLMDLHPLQFNNVKSEMFVHAALESVTRQLPELEAVSSMD